MKRPLFILVAGLLLAGAAYGGLYFARTEPDRELARSPAPELAWLRKEFKLSDDEYRRVAELHAGYREGCMERCHRIALKHEEFQKMLASSGAMTPQIETNMAESAQIRLECQKAMLRHFVEVSRAMPPEQGKRYLAWVAQNTCLNQQGMGMDMTMDMK